MSENKVSLTTYRATDRRVYEGALCSDMQRERKHTQALETRMEKADPTARCTYFPSEGYLVFVCKELDGPPRELTGKFHENKQEALIEAIEVLETK